MLNAKKETKPLINFGSNVFNMICPLWSKIDTVRAALLSNVLLIVISIHLVFSRFKVSLWSFSIAFQPTSRHLAYHSAPGKMSHNSKSRCRLHRGTHSSIPECLADKWCKYRTTRGLICYPRHPVSYWQLVRHLIPTRCALFSFSDIGTKPLKRISRQTIRRLLRQ